MIISVSLFTEPKRKEGFTLYAVNQQIDTKILNTRLEQVSSNTLWDEDWLAKYYHKSNPLTWYEEKYYYKLSDEELEALAIYAKEDFKPLIKRLSLLRIVFQMLLDTKHGSNACISAYEKLFPVN